MLQRTDTFYGGIQSKYILMRLASNLPPPTLVFSLADDDDIEASLSTDAIERMARGEALDRCEEMECRLQAACAGLLEVDFRERTFLTDVERYKRLEIVDLFETAYGSRIQFIHRTARDFFERPDVLNKLQSSIKQTSFEPNLFMARGWTLALIKLPTGGLGYEVNTMLSYATKLANKVQESHLSLDVTNVRKVLEDVASMCDGGDGWIIAKYRLKSDLPPGLMEDDANQNDDTESLAAGCESEIRADTVASVATEEALTTVRHVSIEQVEKQEQQPAQNAKSSLHAGQSSAHKRTTKSWQRLLCCADFGVD
jgi:hypothetical protein